MYRDFISKVNVSHISCGPKRAKQLLETTSHLKGQMVVCLYSPLYRLQLHTSHVSLPIRGLLLIYTLLLSNSILRVIIYAVHTEARTSILWMI